MTAKERYRLYLASDHWRSLRAQAIKRWSDRCNNCSVPGVEVHHLRYGTLYDVTTNDLLPLCPRCHGSVHESERLLQIIRSNDPSESKRKTVLAYLAGKDESAIEAAKKLDRLRKLDRMVANADRALRRAQDKREVANLTNHLRWMRYGQSGERNLRLERRLQKIKRSLHP